jgi:AhpD family alkylhydroperoxidase
MAATMRVSVPPVSGGDLASRSFLAHQPEALAAFQHLYGVLWSRGVLDQATKEVARIRNARITDCGICRSLRFDGARREGLTEEKVERIRDGYLTSDLESRHKAVLRYTDAFLMAPGCPSEELRRELAAHFTPEQIVELTAGIALFMGFSKIAVALGQIPDGLPVMVVPTPAP